MTTALTDLELAHALRKAIDDKMLGRDVTSASGGGRSVSYSDRSVDELIIYYRQVRARIPQHHGELPVIEPLKGGSDGSRRPPARYRSNGFV